MEKSFQNIDIDTKGLEEVSRLNSSVHSILDNYQLNLVLKHIKYGLLLEDSKRQIVMVNEPFLEIFGIPISPEQMLGFNCAESASDTAKLFEDEQGFLLEIERTLESKQKVENLIIKMKDGRYLCRDYVPLWKDKTYDGHLWVYSDVTAQEKFKDTIKTQRQFYEEILNKIPADIAVFDKSHTYLFVNPNGIRDAETRQWIIGKKDEDYCHLKNKPLSLAEGRRAIFNKAVESKKTIIWDEVIDKPDGSQEIHMRMMTPVMKQDGSIEMVIGYGLNVTDAKNNEKAIIEANRHLAILQNLIDNSSDAIQVATEDGKIFYLNAEAYKRLGIEKVDTLKYKVSDFDRQYIDKDTWTKHVDELKSTNSIIEEVENVNLKTHQTFPAEVTVKYINIDNSGYIIANSRDITERKKTLNVLKSKQAMLNAVAKSNGELLSNPNLYDACKNALTMIGEAVNADRVYLFESKVIDGKMVVSQKFEWNKLLHETIINHSNLQNIPLESLGEMGVMLQENTSYNAIVKQINNTSIRADLEQRNIKSILVIPVMHNQTFWGYVGYDDCSNERNWSDDEITLLKSFAKSIENAIDRKALEERSLMAKEIAEKATEAKSEFLASMSHEIRTPMNAFIGLTGLLAKTELNDKQKYYVDLIGESAEQLLMIVNDILDLEKINSGKVDLESIDFALELRVEKSIETYRYRAEEKSIKLQFLSHLPQNLVVEGDPYRLTQILNNLIGNAVKFTKEGRIGVELDIVEKNNNNILVEIKIRDTGIGILREHIDNIFEPYSQAGREIAGKFGGTGLGLSISKSIAELQGGSISVESEFGKGSTFTVRLPFVVSKSDAESIPNIKDTTFKTSAFFRGKHILVAEDVEINRFLVKSILENWGCFVTLAEDGIQAIEIANSNAFDLILMDIQMPGKDGVEATDIILKQSNYNEAPVVALTAHALKGDDKKYSKLGFKESLSKPFTEESLHNVLLEVMKDNPVNTYRKDVSHAMHYKLSYLERISNGKNDFIIKMLKLFVLNTPLVLDELDAAYRFKEMEAFKKALHKIKPSLSNLMMEECKELIVNIEHKIEQNVIDIEFEEYLLKLIALIKITIEDIKMTHLIQS